MSDDRTGGGSRRISLGKRTPTPAPVVEPEPAPAPVGKGRPTPKRSQAQRRRGGPVPPPPASRREAAKRQRAQQVQARRDVRAGTVAGDPGRMLPRDLGPVRALVRNVVDGRRNIAVLLLPVAMVLLIAQLVGDSRILAIATRLWAATLLAVLVDLVLVVLSIRRAVTSAHPGEKLRGHVFYGLLRSTLIRRFRMPPARVAPPRLFRSR